MARITDLPPEILRSILEHFLCPYLDYLINNEIPEGAESYSKLDERSYNSQTRLQAVLHASGIRSFDMDRTLFTVSKVCKTWCASAAAVAFKKSSMRPDVHCAEMMSLEKRSNLLRTVLKREERLSVWWDSDIYKPLLERLDSS